MTKWIFQLLGHDLSPEQINENTNGLVKQYFPTGTDFNALSDEDMLTFADKHNRLPRKTGNYRAPNEIFFGAFS